MTQRMLKSAIVQYVVALMISLAPPDRPHFVPEAQETPDLAKARYNDIAKAMVNVAYDPTFRPLYSGTRARLRSLSLIFAIAYMESGFRRDIDLGLGRHRLGKMGWNDHGRSWCMMQVNLGKNGDTSASNTSQGWSGLDLVQDRQKCFMAGAEVLRISMGSCPGASEGDRLRVYASGSCDKGEHESRVRMRRARQTYSALVGKGVPKDSEVTAD